MIKRRTQWMAAFVVTAACGSKKPPDPLGPLHPVTDPGGAGQASVAARQNAEGIDAYRTGKFAEASTKFRNAVVRVPNAPYFLNLCLALVREDKLQDALTSCEAAKTIDDITPEQRAQAERVVAHIRTEAQRRGITFSTPSGNPPPPEWEK